MKIIENAVRGPMDAPEWFVTRCEELSRLMTSTPRDVADGLWLELIQKGLVAPTPVPGRVLGPLGWKAPTTGNAQSRTGPAVVVQPGVQNG